MLDTIYHGSTSLLPPKRLACYVPRETLLLSLKTRSQLTSSLYYALATVTDTVALLLRLTHKTLLSALSPLTYLTFPTLGS